MGIRLDDKTATARRWKPSLKQDLEKARQYESLLRVFTEPMLLNEIEDETAWMDVKSLMRRRLNSDRMYKRAMDFVTFPLPVVNISNKNLSDIYKVFDSRNSYFHYQIDNKGVHDELAPMLEELAPVRWIEEQGRKVLANQPCSVVVVDKKEDGTPYLLLIDIDRVIDAEFKNESELEFIMFKHSKKGDKQLIALYDSHSYRVYEEGKTEEKDDLILISENEHGAGFCPARMFISKPLNSRVGFSRWSPLACTTSKMIEWTAFDAWSNYADTYAAFPMIQMPEEACEIDGCKEGLIERQEGYVENNVKMTRTFHDACPACDKRELVGAGVVIKMPVKQSKDDPEAPETKFIEAPVKSLEFLQKKLDRIERNISFNSTGADKLMELEAINEQQVNGAFETRKNVLLNIKRHFDDLYGWILITAIKLTAPEVTVKVHGDFGTDFYLQSEQEIQKLFADAIKNGLPSSEKEMLYKQLIETKYRNDPGKQTRSEMLYLIDPMPFDNEETSVRKVKMGTVSEADMILHDNLIAWVNKFEAAQGPIIQFGVKLPLSERLKAIIEILNKNKNGKDEQLRLGSEGAGSEGTI
jgi:hypothetical protein